MAKFPARLTLAGIVVDRPGYVEQRVPWQIIRIRQGFGFVGREHLKVDSSLPWRFSFRSQRASTIARNLQVRAFKNDIFRDRHEMHWRTSFPWLPLIMTAYLVMTAVFLPTVLNSRNSRNVWDEEVRAALPTWAKIEMWLFIGIVIAGAALCLIYAIRHSWTWIRAYRVYPTATTTSHGVELHRLNGQFDFVPWSHLSATREPFAPLQFRDSRQRVLFFPRDAEFQQSLWWAATNSDLPAVQPQSLTWKQTTRTSILVNAMAIPILMAHCMAFPEVGIIIIAFGLLIAINLLLLLSSPLGAAVIQKISSGDKYLQSRRKKRNGSAAWAYCR